ncbi:DNA internalization-related competence protein ComEC/Rec2 [Lactobacillus sp. CBA3605]|nr:DNA internalization-related competence protein ComEC/Rec2 [Lactobacillus sp. CBA3605]
MRGLFFAAIGSGLLSSWLVGQQWPAAGLLGLWGLRLIYMRQRRLLMGSVCIMVVMAGWLIFKNRQFAQISGEMPQTVTLSITVQPDQIRFKGGQYQLLATSVHGRLISYGRLASAAEKQQLSQITQRTQWQVVGELAPVGPPTNPGQFDGPSYYRSQGIYRQLTIKKITALTSAPRTGWLGGLDWIHQVRQQFSLTLERLPPTLQLYAKSLLVGLRPVNFRPQMTSVQQLGLMHLFSLSGLHVILLVRMLRWVLVRGHLSQTAIDYWLLGLLPVYLVFGGGADSLQRAVITAWLPLGWQLLTRQASGALAGWSLALLIGIWTNPLVLLQLGGQLSYGLALLLILAPPMPAWRLSGWVQLLSLPVILTATAQWHLLTLLVNLIVAPLFSWGLLPLTIIGASLGQYSLTIATWCEQGLALFQRGIDWVGTLPGLLTIGRPVPWLAWGLTLTTLWLLRTPAKRWAIRLGLAYLGLILSIRWPLRGAVQFIDIGQGDSILIRQPFNRQVSLIDTGGRLHFPTPAWQTGGQSQARVETITVNYLHQLGLNHLDTVYLSHKDVDHIGDLGRLLQLIKVQQVVVPAGMAGLPKFKQLLAQAKWRPRVREVVAGQRFADGLTALHPFQPGHAENADSLVLTGRFGGQQFMFTGDLDQAGERAIVARYPMLRVDVLKLGHHGSKTASNYQALQQLQVRRAILSVGRHNRYGHPNQETLTTLAQQHIITYSTALQGMITYRFGGGRASTWQTFLKEGNFYQRTAGHAGPSAR